MTDFKISDDLVLLGAFTFGPLGTDGPATTGSIRLRNLDTIVIRNAQDDGDHFILESLVSDEFNMFDPLIGRVDFLEANTRFFKTVTVHQDGNSTAALVVGGAGIFIVDTTNRLIRLAQDDAVLTWGTASDAQMHRDAADIIAQRRGLNPQEWRLYDRFVSLSDYDRLAIYIGGGPPLKTIEFVAESTVSNQGISIDIEARAGSSADGRLNLLVGSAQFQMSTGSASLNTPFIITSMGVNSLSMNGFISPIGVGFGTAGIALKIDIAGQGAAAFEDSHSIDLIGAGENANRATWRTFVDVIDVTANSIWTLQDDKNGGGFVTNFSITDDGGFNFPLPLPSHAIGLAIDTQNQLTLGGDYFALAGADLIGTRFKIQDRITNATGNITGFFAMNIDANMRTQGVTESVANIATLNIEEPDIADLLTGGGLITHAQTLLISGAPTEGVSNFAFRILAGDIEIDNSSAFLFDDGGGGSLSALSVAPTNRLEIGLSGTPWARINLYSTLVTLVSNLVVSGAGPHAIAGAAFGAVQLLIGDTFTSDGASNIASGLFHTPTIVGAPGDTSALTGTTLTAGITTQTATESIANIAQLQVNEPFISDNLTGLITQASTVLITGAPTEGVSNDALRIADGRSFFGGQLIVDHDSTEAFQVRKDGDAGDVLTVNTVSNIVTIDGRLVVVGTGASAFGSVFPMTVTSAFTINTTFTAGATGTTAHALDFFPAFTGAAGHTAALSLLSLNGTITTQTATESITNISTMVLNEPSITDNLTGDITNAQTLLIVDAPTEGLSNFAIRVISGNVFFGGNLDVTGTTTTFGRIKTVTRQTTTYTILVTDSVVFGNTDSAGFTATLPAGVSGQTFKVINSGSSGNTLTVTPDGSEDLLGVNSSFSLFDGEALNITFDSTDGWY